jgi:hypothetical protein
VFDVPEDAVPVAGLLATAPAFGVDVEPGPVVVVGAAPPVCPGAVLDVCEDAAPGAVLLDDIAPGLADCDEPDVDDVPLALLGADMPDEEPAPFEDDELEAPVEADPPPIPDGGPANARCCKAPLNTAVIVSAMGRSRSGRCFIVIRRLKIFIYRKP